ncbi:hypothetical protein C8R47DRAFT_1078340 [Mycena vitilis]|nr:hypothetical protein C8R47DRAFT_1078340 [Mycena vitilis]
MCAGQDRAKRKRAEETFHHLTPSGTGSLRKRLKRAKRQPRTERRQSADTPLEVTEGSTGKTAAVSKAPNSGWDARILRRTDADSAKQREKKTAAQGKPQHRCTARPLFGPAGRPRLPVEGGRGAHREFAVEWHESEGTATRATSSSRSHGRRKRIEQNLQYSVLPIRGRPIGFTHLQPIEQCLRIRCKTSCCTHAERRAPDWQSESPMAVPDPESNGVPAELTSGQNTEGRPLGFPPTEFFAVCANHKCVHGKRLRVKIAPEPRVARKAETAPQLSIAAGKRLHLEGSGAWDRKKDCTVSRSRPDPDSNGLPAQLEWHVY